MRRHVVKLIGMIAATALLVGIALRVPALQPGR